MPNTSEQRNVNTLFDYFSILVRWKNFFIVNILFFGMVAGIVAFLIPKTYKSEAVIMLPEDNSMGLGGLSSLIGGGKSSVASLGAKMFGIGGASEDMILGILNSRNALENVVEKFDLYKYYEIDDKNRDKVLRAFKSDLIFEPTEFGMISIEVINKDPNTAANIANYFVELLDSLNIRFNTEQAHNNRLFIEKRYEKNLADLKSAEDSMFNFQRKFGIFAVPEQLEVAVKAAAELEIQLTAKEAAYNFLKIQIGEYAPATKNAFEEVKFLRNKVEELKSSDRISTSTNIFFPFKEIPEMNLQYYRLYREIEIQSAILEVLLPMFEQIKVEEQKSIPTIVVVDKAVPAELKYAPKRMFIILGAVFLAGFILIPLIFLFNVVLNQNKNSFTIIHKIASIFRVK